MIKIEQYGDTPLIELHKGIFQNGSIWTILDTKKPAVYKIYFTMVSLVILSPEIRNKHAKYLFDKYAEKQHLIPVWLPYGQISARCRIGSYTTIKKALDEIKAKGLIKNTDDDGVYTIGYISKLIDVKYRLYLSDLLDLGPKALHLPVVPTYTPVCSPE